MKREWLGHKQKRKQRELNDWINSLSESDSRKLNITKPKQK